MMDTAELRARIADQLRAHQLVNTRCQACGEPATHQSLHQADVLIKTFDIQQRVTVIPDPPGFELPWA